MNDLIRQLKRDRTLFTECPTCGESFRLADAELFPASGDWPAKALEILERRRQEIRERRAELKARRERMTSGSRRTAEAVNLGKIVEKIAPSFPTFTFEPRDCRSLLEPIDYVVFEGLTRRGRVEALHFVDVKSGKASLTQGQKQIRDRVQDGRVTFRRLPARKGAR